MITFQDFVESEYNDSILNAPCVLLVDGKRIEVTEEISTPEFIKQYELYEVVEIRPTTLSPTQDDIVEEDEISEVNVNFRLAFLVELRKYVQESEDKNNG